MDDNEPVNPTALARAFALVERPLPCGKMIMNDETLSFFERKFPGIRERATLVEIPGGGTAWMVTWNAGTLSGERS